MKELRLAMLEGRSAPECGRCYREERFSMRSQRQNFNDLFAEQVAFRRVPTAADLSFASKDLQQVRWCTSTSKEPACKAR